MTLDKEITREEFDTRLVASTQRIRERRLALESETEELEDLLGRYSSILERMEAEAHNESTCADRERDDLRRLLNELAARTSAVAASLV